MVCFQASANRFLNVLLIKMDLCGLPLNFSPPLMFPEAYIFCRCFPKRNVHVSGWTLKVITVILQEFINNNYKANANSFEFIGAIEISLSIYLQHAIS